MDSDSHAENEFASNSTAVNPQSACSYGSAIFSGSHHFTVAGGTFTSVTKNYTTAPTVPSDFRMIPLGDIDLQHEIRVDKKSDVVNRQRERHSVRRVYSAKIEGHKSSVTVAMYQGDDAEQEWRQDVAKYIHPNILQICGAASSDNIHATLFHGAHLTVSTALVDGIDFEIELSSTTEDTPIGYLFLCPPEEFQTGPSSFK
ncbi:hypothetical protein MVEN_02147200 [Mycena venus]|uniref:Uncharacterized protein n=1 Tax=Mycena venus TaxID=2733690 RepID=A0A8H6XAQ3_9AGAR|nr:hypothetical protein MVEN_02147200 [Mycena venus]